LISNYLQSLNNPQDFLPKLLQFGMIFRGLLFRKIFFWDLLSSLVRFAFGFGLELKFEFRFELEIYFFACFLIEFVDFGVFEIFQFLDFVFLSCLFETKENRIEEE